MFLILGSLIFGKTYQGVFNEFPYVWMIVRGELFSDAVGNGHTYSQAVVPHHLEVNCVELVHRKNDFFHCFYLCYL